GGARQGLEVLLAEAERLLHALERVEFLAEEDAVRAVVTDGLPCGSVEIRQELTDEDRGGADLAVRPGDQRENVRAVLGLENGPRLVDEDELPVLARPAAEERRHQVQQRHDEDGLERRRALELLELDDGQPGPDDEGVRAVEVATQGV